MAIEDARQNASDARQDASEVRQAWSEDRISKVESAIVQINHATEVLVEWKAEVSADLRWLKYLVGIGAAAGLFSALAEVAKVLKGG